MEEVFREAEPFSLLNPGHRELLPVCHYFISLKESDNASTNLATFAHRRALISQPGVSLDLNEDVGLCQLHNVNNGKPL